MKKKKSRAAIAVVAWRRKPMMVNAARAMLAKKTSAPVRQNPWVLSCGIRRQVEAEACAARRVVGSPQAAAVFRMNPLESKFQRRLRRSVELADLKGFL